MPKITVSGYGIFEIEEGQRLVNALATNGVDIGHRCGGYARCTTCRVEVTEGEPEVISRAEQEKLADRDLLGEVRLACQILVEHDMTLRPLMTVGEMGWPDPGPDPEETVTPIPDWVERS
jgi:ferredoxin